MKSPETEQKLISEGQNTQNEPGKHCYWDSWVLLTLTAAILFSIRELCMVEFSHLSFEGLLYMGAGSIPFPVGYFIVQGRWK